MSKALRALAVVAAAVAVAGCGTPMVWRNHGYSDPARFSADTMLCQQHGATTAPYRMAYGQYDLGVAMLLGARQAAYEAAYGECMSRLGWYQARQ